MDKLERLEELKRKVMSKLLYQDTIPEEVNKIIIDAFKNLSRFYEDMRYNSISIDEYIQGNLKIAQSEISKRLDIQRKEIQIQDIKAIFGKIQEEVEEQINEKNNQKYEQEFEQIGPDNKKITMMVTQILKDMLQDVQSRQIRILSSRGYNENVLDNIQQKTMIFINKLVKNDDSKIYEELMQDDKNMKQWILEEYEAYLEQEKSDESKQEQKKDARQEFVETLDSNISLEEQHKFATEIVSSENERENEKERDLPDDVIL